MSETREIRLKRLHMRSIRRGIKEMDIILGNFSEHALPDLSDLELETYDRLLAENDQDLYQWVTGQALTPVQYIDIMTKISDHSLRATVALGRQI
ncbi:MAG: succinate dehydrogenase assembly factor 2 [Pseudomonadota bacterium]